MKAKLRASKSKEKLVFGSSGFSMIELMVVIAVAGLLMSILVSTMYQGKTRETEVYNAAREFGTYVLKYRIQGINENVCYIFSFTADTSAPATNKYEIYKNDSCDGLIASSTLIKTVNLSSYKYSVMFGNYGTSPSDGIGISGSATLFYFKPRGFLDVSTAVVIYFTTKDDYASANKAIQVRARVDNLTGRVDIERYREEPW